MAPAAPAKVAAKTDRLIANEIRMTPPQQRIGHGLPDASRWAPNEVGAGFFSRTVRRILAGVDAEI